MLSVVEGSPADGVLRPGDVIIRLEDQPIESVEDFYATLRGFKPGRRVTIEILRDGERRQVEMRLASRPD